MACCGESLISLCLIQCRHVSQQSNDSEFRTQEFVMHEGVNSFKRTINLCWKTSAINSPTENELKLVTDNTLSQ